MRKEIQIPVGRTEIFPRFSFGHDLRKIRDRGEFFQQGAQQCQPIRPHPPIFDHHHHLVEKGVDRLPRRESNFRQRLQYSLLAAMRFHRDAAVPR